jgi:LysM repeat protein
MRWSRAFLVGILFVLLSGTFQANAEGPTHTVERGENLFRIALRYGVTVEALAAANNITDPTHIFVGQVLVIPGAAVQDSNQAPAQPQAPAQAQAAPPNPPENAPAANQPPANAVYYTVQSGDTLNIIAKKFGLSWVDLSNANNLSNANVIQPGQQLIIPGSSSPAGSATVPSVPNTAAAPVVPPTAIPPTSVPPTAIPPTAVPPPQPAQSGVTGSSKTYVVQTGEGLAAIARKFNLTWPVLAQANNIGDPNTIYAGMTLTIPDAAPNPNPTTMETSVGVPPGPAPTPSTGKYIKVMLREQRVYAYQDGQMVHTVLASTGLPGTPTVTGDFKIYLKYTSQLMTGDGYYLPGVPWVMYFYEGYSLHGTYWHHNFGHPMSHGCVNLPTDEALWFFKWAEIGTPVHVEW